MNPTVVLWPEHDGREVVYHPANRLADALCAFAGVPVIKPAKLRHLRAMGFEVRVFDDAPRRPRGKTAQAVARRRGGATAGSE